MAKRVTGPEIEKLIQLLAKVPGLGPRSARRAALHLIKKKDQLLGPLGHAMGEAYDKVKICSCCGNVDTIDPCSVCTDVQRDSSVIIVVEDVSDLWALERAGAVRASYHVLGATLSPFDGIGPEDLALPRLVERATAGSVRDYVLGARFINGRGELLTFGGQVMKNVAGYDVSRLMAGSWGTLGLITEVSLKVLPVAPAEATLMIAGLAQGPALDLLHRWGGQPLPLNASAWVRDTTAQPVADYLFVRLRGAVAAVQSALGKMSADAVALGAQVQQMDNAEAAQDWRASGEQTLPFFDAPSPEACLWRLSVPQTAPALDLPYPTYIEWQGAQRWLWAPASAALALRGLAQKVGGHATLFRASAAHADTDKAAGVNTPLDAVQQRIQQQLQKQFDPKGVFATGRMHPTISAI